MEQQILELQSTMHRIQNENLQLRSSMQATMQHSGSSGSALPLAPTPSMGYIAPPFQRSMVRNKSRELNAPYDSFAVRAF